MSQSPTESTPTRIRELRIRRNEDFCPRCSARIYWQEVYEVGLCPRRRNNRFKTCYLCASTEWESRNVG